ncbi:TonB-dependent siderophore receptor [Sphingomonadaceae bacterium jetA1]|uniref:TonB-dependent siderophore receptor n=1 Tax=Facivitalis istanbulensis TaxID=3075838 RepID=UPI00346A9A6D
MKHQFRGGLLRRLHLSSSSAAFLALAATVALGQSASAEERDGIARDDETAAKQDITVLGKRTEGSDSYTKHDADTVTGLRLSIRETPQTVTVLTRQLLDDQQIETMDDVLQTTPGVTSSQLDNAGRSTYRARGFDITNYRVDGAQVDGQSTFGGAGASTNIDLYDNLQIVRGANGLLGGTGDPSATIYLLRKRPTKTLSGIGALTLGNWGRRRLMGDLNLPITKGGEVRTRLVYSDEATDTFRDREHVDRQGLLASAEVDLTPRSTLNIGVQYEKTVNDGASWGANVPIWFADGTLAKLPRSTNPVADWSEARRKTTTGFVNLDHRWGADWHLRVSYNRTRGSAFNDLGVAKANNAARSVGGFAGFFHQDGTGGFLNAIHSEYENRRDNIDAAVDGTIHVFGREHMLMAGFNGYWDTVTNYAFSFALGNCNILGKRPYSGCQYRSDGLPIADWRAWDGSYARLNTYRTDARAVDRTRNLGGYVATRLDLADPLKVILGARLSDFKSTGGDYNAANRFTADSTITHEKGVFTPYAGIVFDMTRALSLYASYTSVFTPQGDLRDANDALLKPITGKSYEAGVKGSFNDGRLNASLAVFNNRQSNVAENTGLLNDRTGNAVYRTVDGVRSRGVDIDASGMVLPGWNILFGYSYLDVDGLSYQRDPSHQVRLSTSYTLPGSWNRLTVGGGLSAQSKTTWSTNPGRPLGGGRYDATNLTVSGYMLANLLVRYRINDHLQIGANVTNLTDKTYYRQYGFYDGLIYGEPRSYSVNMRARF